MPGRAICFVCGNPGAETSVHVMPQDRGPYFPFLEHHDPPKGSRTAAADGSVDSCRVCYAFLTQQWETYERTKTPAIKRLYWLKRADNGNFTGAEMKYQGEYIAQVMGLQYAPGSFDEPGSPDGSSYLPEREYSRPSQKENSQYTLPQQSAQLPERHSIPDRQVSQKHILDGALDLSTSKIADSIQRSAQLNKHPESRSFTCFVCNQVHGHHNGVYIYLSKQPNNEPYFPVLEKIPHAQGTDYVSGQVKVCLHCKNVLYQQWQAYEMSGTPIHLRTYKIPDELLAHMYNDTRSVVKVEAKQDNKISEFHCYICGLSNIPDHAQSLKTLPPKSPAPATMFFPFVRELKRPPRAEPLRSDGSVVVCIKCYGHLSYQWQIQECEGVPLYHRQYSLGFLSAKSGTNKPEVETKAKVSPTEVAVQPLNIQISQASPIKSDRNTEQQNYSSAQGLLTIAPHAEQSSRPISRQSDQPSSAVKGYDSVHDSKSGPTESTMTTACKTVPHPLQQVSDIPKKTCFLCSEKCIIHKMMLLNAYPSRHEAKHISTPTEPFFPFLDNITPVPNADPVSEDGTVIVCKLCYYTLLKQWMEYESSPDPSHSNRWLRKYSLPDYICYVCATSQERKLMRSLAVNKFHFLNEHKAPPGALVMDGGERVAVCKSCAYSLMQQFAEFERMGVPPELRKYNWMNRSAIPDVALDEESQDERKFETMYSSNQPSSSEDTQRFKQEMERQELESSGAIPGSKPPPLNMLSPAASKIQRNTATVSPLHHVTSPANGVNSAGGNAVLTASRTSSFAAALRKLANQAKDSPDEPGQKSSSSMSPREASSNAGPPPLVYTSNTLTSPPVVTIAPTPSHPSLLATEPRPALERLHSSQSSSSLYEPVNMKTERERPQSSQSRDDDRAASRDNHSHPNRRITPHSTPGTVSPMSMREEGSTRGFQPYRPGDDMRPPFPASLAMDPAAAAAAAAYSYPAAFLTPHAYPHPAFRFDDPLLLERYRMMQHPYLSYPTSMLSHPGLHPLLAAGGRYPSDLLPHHLQFASQSGRLPEHRSPLLSERQRLEEEKQRDIEREREKEREKERELAIQRERQKLLDRESEKQRERERSAAHRDREMEQRESMDKPKMDMATPDKSEESLAARFGSIIQGTPKGLGIADRYPRAPSSSSGAVVGERREDRKGTKEDYGGSQGPSSFTRPPAHKGFGDDKKYSESEKRYSLVNPMRESDQSRRPPLVSAKPRDEAALRTRKSPEGNLFRPFDSKHIPNGYSDHTSERDKLFHYHANDEQNHSHGNDLSQSVDRKPNNLVKKDEDRDASHGSKFGSTSSAFHSLDNRVSNSQLPSHRSDLIPSHSSSHSTNSKPEKPDLHPMSTYHNYQTPLNVPNYHSATQPQIGPISSTHATESPRCVSKLDNEEKKISESRSNGSYCSDSECDSDTEDEGQQRSMLISSGPPLHLDTSPRKMKLLSELGLTTQRHRKDKEYERLRKRRRRMREQSVSPVTIDDCASELSPLQTPYNPIELCREPDYMLKCHFLSQFYNLKPVSSESRKANTAIQQACEEAKIRRKLSQADLTEGESAGTGVKRKHEGDPDPNTSPSNVPNPDSSLPISRRPDLRQYNRDHLHKLSNTQNSDSDKRSKDHRDVSAMFSLPKVDKDFVQDFHDSVLQTTREKELAQRLGHSGDVHKKADTPSRHREHSQSSGSHSVQPYLYSTPGQQPWAGVDAVMESYQQHQQGEKLETHILMERNKKMRTDNVELNKTAQQLSRKMEDLLKNKQQLEELRHNNQARIDGLKSTMKKLR